MKWFVAAVNIGIVLFVILFFSTIWAIGKTRDRTECYRKAVEECALPGWYEQLIRDIVL